MKTIDTIDTSPFKKLVMTIGELPTTFIESMSYYEALAWLVDYIKNTVIPAVNNNAEAVKELQDLFIELKDYVDNYFDNLDVQEEINNKIDAMVESGELQRIINIPATTTTIGGVIVGDGLDVQEDGTLSLDTDAIKEEGFADGGLHTGEYLFTRYRATGTATTFNNAIPREMEGIAYTGFNKAVVTYKPANVTDSSSILFEEIDFSTPTAPQIVKSATIAGVGSSNNICYNPNTGKIYSFVADNIFAVIDYATFNLLGTITIPSVTLASCIAYDNDNDKFYITEGLHVWELNINNLNTTLLFTFSNNDIKNGLQGFEVRNGKFYFVEDHPRSIVVTDFSGNIEQILSINEYDNVGHYSSYTGDISFVDDSNILITPHCEGDFLEFTSQKSSFYINYVSKININGDNFESNSVAGMFHSKEIFVDTTVTADKVVYADGSAQHKLELLSEYMNNKFKKLYNFRIDAPEPVTYYGTLIMANEDLVLLRSFVCEGTSIRGGSLVATGGITVNSSRMTTYGTAIYAPTIKLGFNDVNDKNTFISSNLVVTDITDLNGNAAIYNLYNSSKMNLNCDVLFSNPSGATTGITLGNITGYKKIKIYVTDSSSQQDSIEILTMSGTSEIYANFDRYNIAGTSWSSLESSRVIINQSTGAVTIDREYTTVFNGTPSITYQANSGRLKITRVEGYF